MKKILKNRRRVLKRKTKMAMALQLVEKKQLIQSSDLIRAKILRQYIEHLLKEGLIKRVAKGLYAASNCQLTSRHMSLLEASKRINGGVICLLSALRFHELTTQLPSEVWIAIDRNKYVPKETLLPIKVMRFASRSFIEGIDHYLIDGISVKIYSPAKTIADCFKYRNKIGLDVAIEVLKDGFKKNKYTVDEVAYFAKVNNVFKIIKPYMESILVQN